MAHQQKQTRLFWDCYECEYDFAYNNEGCTEESYCIPPGMISWIQNEVVFQGLEEEDPSDHIKRFLNYCNMFEMPGLSQDKLRRLLFPFSLKGKAETWYYAARGDSMTTFEELAHKFDDRFVSPAMMDKLRAAILQFRQLEEENFAGCWERFNGLFRKYPGSIIEEGYELYIFYKGLTLETKTHVDASAGGTLNDKTSDEVRSLFQTIAENGSSGYSERITHPRQKVQVLELNAIGGIEVHTALPKEDMTELRPPQELEDNLGTSNSSCQMRHETTLEAEIQQIQPTEAEAEELKPLQKEQDHVVFPSSGRDLHEEAEYKQETEGAESRPKEDELSSEEMQLVPVEVEKQTAKDESAELWNFSQLQKPALPFPLFGLEMVVIKQKLKKEGILTMKAQGSNQEKQKVEQIETGNSQQNFSEGAGAEKFKSNVRRPHQLKLRAIPEAWKQMLIEWPWDCRLMLLRDKQQETVY